MWRALGILCFVDLASGGVVRLVLSQRPPMPYSSLNFVDQPMYHGLVPQTTKPPVTFFDYRYAQPNQAILRHIQRVLDRIAALRHSVNPRIRRLYEILKKDLLNNYQDSYAGELYSISDLLDIHPSMRPPKSYDINKLSKLDSTEKDM